MLFFPTLNNPYCGKMLTLPSVQNSDNRRFNDTNTLNEWQNQKDKIIGNNRKRFVAITGLGLALMMPINRAFGDADSEFLAKLTAEWWQWALSIPTVVNPQSDTTGQNAVVGQRGPIWFLAGVLAEVRERSHADALCLKALPSFSRS